LRNPAILAGLASPKSFDAQRIGDEFYAVPAADRNARGIWEKYHNDRKSATYEQLEQDPDAALVRVQLEQIRTMQSAIFIEREGGEPTRAFASFSVIEGGGRTFSTHPEIVSDVSLQIRLLTRIRKEMIEFEKRYTEIGWLVPMARRISETATQHIQDMERDLGLPDREAIPNPRQRRRPSP
jgi:hypothetical protein